MTKKEEQATEIEVKDSKDISAKSASKKIVPKKVKTEKAVETPAVEEAAEQTEVKGADKLAKPLAKAGKRSIKAIEEVEQKQAKEERKLAKSSGKVTDAKKTSDPAKKPTRSKLERSGKKFKEVAKLIDKSKNYSLAEAVELAAKTSPVKFDATVEMHINLNVDPKQADQNVRDIVVLPGGTGKSVKIAVLAEAEDAAKALKAGADTAGSDELLAELDKENINFDVLIAAPAMMQRLSKYARLLGPRGLMPNPKSGTVSADVVKAVTEAKAGRVEYRVDSNGIIHLGFGKVSFGADKLTLNAEAVMASVRAAKPASVKSNYIASLHVCSSMGPSIRVQV